MAIGISIRKEAFNFQVDALPNRNRTHQQVTAFWCQRHQATAPVCLVW